MKQIEQKTLQKWLRFFTSSEFLMLLATFAALAFANSDFQNVYTAFTHEQFQISLLNFQQEITLSFFIDDILMVLFFLLVGLELKREMLVGELSNKSHVLLPVVAAFGGTIVPAIIFILINFDHPQNLRGFAIPTATDIVFTYVIVKMFYRKISHAAKIFLITLAVVDDLIAIVIIALFYTAKLSLAYFGGAIVITFILAFLNVKKVQNIVLYLFLGILLWFCTLKSGIHPTLSGVALAAFIPFRINNEFPLRKLAEVFAPVVNFIILPIFAFANAGVRIIDFAPSIMLDFIVLGISCGLFFGKQLGIFFSSLILIKMKLCELPKGSNFKEFYYLSILAGIGFTMSLFVGNLAFASEELLDKVKFGVLLGSSVSAIVGGLFLFFKEDSKFAVKKE